MSKSFGGASGTARIASAKSPAEPFGGASGTARIASAKSPATRLLDQCGIRYRTAEFAAADFTAEEAVEKLGVPAADVFKTLVVKGDATGPIAAVVPTPARLSLKKLARASGNKTVTMVAPEEMERLTGYVKGGCSPFGMRKAMPVFVDASARGKERLYCSAGRRGVQLVLRGDDLIAAAQATAADLVED